MESDCIFCNISSLSFLDQTEHLFVVRDQYPVSPGHLLIIPKMHRKDFFELSHEEFADLETLLRSLKMKMQNEDQSISGFNIGANCGETAGQTIFHCHIHLIPRRAGDVENPRGGVRAVVPSKQNY